MKFWIFVLLFFSIFNTVFAYSDDTTHPGLTDEIVDLFNLYYPELKISGEHKELAKKGSTDEDKKPRSMYHFYDPVYNRGIHLAGTKWQSSKDWAQDTMGQASLLDQALAGSLTSYFSSDADHSWDRAVYEYAWGDKERAIYDLGHTLHLIEDASVPDHTRNDPHPPWFHFGSPYEAWTAQFDSEKLEGLAKSLYGASRKPVVFSDLQEYFNSIASYSNNNFFSKDTIFHDKYSKPNVDFEKREQLKDGSFIIVGYNFIDNDFSKLVGKIVETKWNKLVDTKNKNKSFILDNDHLILSDYWSRLSKQAVLHGAGVVKLFFDEVEKEKRSKVLFNKNKSWFAKTYDAAKGKVFGISTLLYGSSLKPDDLAELNNGSPTVQRNEQTSVVAPNDSISISDFSNTEISPASVVSPNSPIQFPSVSGSNVGVGIENSSLPLARGVREDGNFSNLNIQSTENVKSSVSNNLGSGGPFNTPRVAPENDNVVADDAPLPEISASGGGSLVDTIPPEISFSVSQCSSSLSPDGCLLASSNLSISWSSTSTDLASYDIECSLSGSACSSFSFSATTATSTNYSFPTDEKIYQFRARARDTASNVSDWVTTIVEYYSSPVVINEVAWAGTFTSSADEWVELLNRTGKNISLSGWVLQAQDQVPYLNLSGTISANGYYLIERTNDNTVSDISADLIIPFSGVGSGSGLSNSGEVLILSNASTTIDQTVLCGSAWCGGTSSSGNLSMERIDPNVAGTDGTNWGTTNYLATRNGKDANNLQLNATPKRRNSLNYLISQTSNLTANKTLTKSKSPYIIPTSQDFIISAGVMLVIEPGAVIKMGGQSSMTILGKIISSGTAEEPVIFTSVYDNLYGGETNSESSPTAGSWTRFRIQSPSEDSVVNYTKFFYGGWYSSLWSQDLRAMVSVYEATTTISNSTFEKSFSAGLRATRFNGTISGSSFNTGTTTNTDKVGLFIYEGSLTISGSTFSNNYSGLTLESAVANLDNLTFSNNYLGIQSINSTLNVANPTSIIFTNNISTTSPGGLF